VQQLLSSHKLVSYEPYIASEARSILLVNDLPAALEASSVFNDWLALFTKVIAVSLLRVAMGNAFTTASSPEFLAFQSSILSLLHVAGQPYLGDYIPLFKLFPSAAKIQIVSAVATFRAITSKLLLTVKENMKAGTQTSCMASVLLESGIAQEEAAAIVTDGILGALDTSGKTLEWCVLLLANHYDVQDRLRGEIEDVLGGGDYSLQVDSQMPYLCAVMNESMRWGPVGPIPTPRMATETVTIDGYDIPAGAHIFYNNFDYIHDPEVFPEPHAFRPER
jgi:cytochrome P450